MSDNRERTTRERGVIWSSDEDDLNDNTSQEEPARSNNHEPQPSTSYGHSSINNNCDYNDTTSHEERAWRNAHESQPSTSYDYTSTITQPQTTSGGDDPARNRSTSGRFWCVRIRENMQNNDREPPRTHRRETSNLPSTEDLLELEALNALRRELHNLMQSSGIRRVSSNPPVRFYTRNRSAPPSPTNTALESSSGIRGRSGLQSTGYNFGRLRGRDRSFQHSAVRPSTSSTQGAGPVNVADRNPGRQTVTRISNNASTEQHITVRTTPYPSVDPSHLRLSSEEIINIPPTVILSSVPPSSSQAATHSASTSHVSPSISPLFNDQSDSTNTTRPIIGPASRGIDDSSLPLSVQLDLTNEDTPEPTNSQSLVEEVVEIDPEVTETVQMDAQRRQSDPTRRESNDENRAESSQTKNENSGEGQNVPINCFNQHLLSLLECPVCFEYMEPPMSQCRRGHLVCYRCCARIPSCPVCRGAFTSVRNLAMESVAGMLRYPCRHQCSKMMKLQDRVTHEASCELRRYECPITYCAGATGLYLHKDLIQHIKEAHASLLLFNTINQFSVNLTKQSNDVYFVLLEGELFYVRVDMDRSEGKVIVYAAYVGPKNNAISYTYKVSVRNPINKRKLTYARTTFSDLDRISMVYRHQDCFHISIENAFNFIRCSDNYKKTPHENFEFSVKITH